jgi:hypothetical protein
MDYWSLKEKFFGWVVNAMADMCIAKARAEIQTERDRLRREIGKRFTPPQVQSPPQQPRGSGKVASGQLPAALTDQALR